MVKVNKTVCKVLSFFLVFTFLLGTMNVTAEASTKLSQAVKNAYIDTLELRQDMGDISEVCSDNVDPEEIFSEYYEVLDAYDEDSYNAYYGSVYEEPYKKSKQKTSYKLGTAVDFLEYNIVGFLNEDNKRDVAIYKCKGTLWLRKIEGEYIITKAKRKVTLLDDYTDDLADEDTVSLITELVASFIGDEDYLDDSKDSTSDAVKLTVTDCPTKSYTNKATISGKVSSDGEEYATVTINRDKIEVDEYDGTWSKKVTLKEGENTFEIIAANRAGKTDIVTKKITYYSEAPSLIIDQCPETSSLSEVTISGKVTDKNDKNPKVYINGNLLELDYSGEWSMEVTLKDGANPFEIKAINSEGKSTVINKSIVLSTNSPTIVFTSCPETSAVNKVTISGRVTDTNDSNPKVYINDDQLSLSWSGNTWSKEVTLKEGDNTFIIKATNNLGKTTTITKTIKFNSGAPDLTITSCPETSTVNKVTISGRVTDTNDSNPKIYINNDQLSLSWGDTWSKEVTLKEGDNTFTIKATNSLGKSTTITKTIKFNSGTPDLIITTCPEASTVNKVTISGRVSDTNDSSPKVYINNDQLSLLWSDTWSKEVTLKEGDNTFIIKATNSLGKSTTITKTIKFNIGAPDLIITNCPETSTVSKVTISGQVSDTNDSKPKVYINDDQLSLIWSDTWTKTVELKEGVNTFIIKATNSLGKTSSITKTINFVLEAPNILIDNCPDSSTVNSITISGKVTDTNDEAPKVYMNGELLSLDWDNSWSKNVTLVDGQNNFEIKATNSYGKTTTITKTITYGVTPPTLQVLVCPETSDAATVVISGTVSDVSDNNPLVYINNEAVSVSGGAWSKELTLLSGQNVITIKATNTAGKETTESKTISYTPPAQ